ncbi:DUF58 domain-containing protein [Metallibacterium sp.]|uniref:DUF58 domain-containing protein n=1 Tax=Metallibacterium sp. TaxID=2940281 RepID=UPI002617775E|nr:DUF58 domain-containing protein [Metallibacterium sp.]
MSLARRLRGLTETGRARLLRRHPGLLRARRVESLPIHLGQRRIYVLPTGFGIGFGAMLLVMLLGALNYNNNAALLLTCLLGATCAQSMYGAFRALHGLRLEAVRAEHAEAGGALQVALHFSASRRARTAVCLRLGPTLAAFSLPTGAPTAVGMTLHAERRGWQALPALKLESTWPFGLFRAWSWLYPDARVLIYPAREADGPAPPESGGTDSRHAPSHEQDQDYAGLRDYQPGDPPRRIAWKASARNDQLLLRLHEPPPTQSTWRLRWHDARGLPQEQRIMRLARWVYAAWRSGARWQLELPQQTLGPDWGDAHYHACMAALALLP